MSGEVKYFDAGQNIVQQMLEDGDFEGADSICIVVLKDGECRVGRSWGEGDDSDDPSPFEMPGALMHAATRWWERFLE